MYSPRTACGKHAALHQCSLKKKKIFFTKIFFDFFNFFFKTLDYFCDILKVDESIFFADSSDIIF
jgi:hypothetical protein